jgi:hypothetical protein
VVREWFEHPDVTEALKRIACSAYAAFIVDATGRIPVSACRLTKGDLRGFARVALTTRAADPTAAEVGVSSLDLDLPTGDGKIIAATLTTLRLSEIWLVCILGDREDPLALDVGGAEAFGKIMKVFAKAPRSNPDPFIPPPQSPPTGSPAEAFAHPPWIDKTKN